MTTLDTVMVLFLCAASAIVAYLAGRNVEGKHFLRYIDAQIKTDNERHAEYMSLIEDLTDAAGDYLHRAVIAEAYVGITWNAMPAKLKADLLEVWPDLLKHVSIKDYFEVQDVAEEPAPEDENK